LRQYARIFSVRTDIHDISAQSLPTALHLHPNQITLVTFYAIDKINIISTCRIRYALLTTETVRLSQLRLRIYFTDETLQLSVENRINCHVEGAVSAERGNQIKILGTGDA